MKHAPYLLHLDMLAKLIRNAKHLGLINKKDRNETALQKAANFLYHQEKQMIYTLDFMVDCEEFHWLRSGKQVTFFDSAETARAIIDSSFAIENIASLYNGPEAFMLALPEGLQLGGIPAAGGLLVNICQHDKRGEQIVNDFCSWIKYPAPEVTYDAKDVSDFAIYACYQQKLGSNEYIRFALPSHSLEQIMKFPDAESYSEYINRTNNFHFFYGSDLGAAEQSYQFDLARLIVGLMLYKKALPERIKAGMPSQFKTQHYQSRTIDGHKPQIIHSPATTAADTKGAHYRSWHFRQLMADRFYQGDYAKLRRGERIVFVRDSMVNREIEAETVV
jgi:hypothetical protein